MCTLSYKPNAVCLSKSIAKLFQGDLQLLLPKASCNVYAFKMLKTANQYLSGHLWLHLLPSCLCNESLKGERRPLFTWAINVAL